jgi:hypothetical protein
MGAKMDAAKTWQKPSHSTTHMRSLQSTVRSTPNRLRANDASPPFAPPLVDNPSQQVQTRFVKMSSSAIIYHTYLRITEIRFRMTGISSSNGTHNLRGSKDYDLKSKARIWP